MYKWNFVVLILIVVLFSSGASIAKENDDHSKYQIGSEVGMSWGAQAPIYGSDLYAQPLFGGKIYLDREVFPWMTVGLGGSFYLNYSTEQKTDWWGSYEKGEVVETVDRLWTIYVHVLLHTPDDKGNGLSFEVHNGMVGAYFGNNYLPAPPEVGVTEVLVGVYGRFFLPVALSIGTLVNQEDGEMYFIVNTGLNMTMEVEVN